MCMGGTTRLLKIDRKDPIVAVREWHIHEINGRYLLKPVTMSTGPQGTAWYPEKGPIFRSDKVPGVPEYDTIVKDKGNWRMVGGTRDPKKKPTVKWQPYLIKTRKERNPGASDAGFYTHAERDYYTHSNRCAGIVNIFGNVVRHSHNGTTAFGYRAEYAEIVALFTSNETWAERLTRSYGKIVPIIIDGTLPQTVSAVRW